MGTTEKKSDIRNRLKSETAQLRRLFSEAGRQKQAGYGVLMEIYRSLVESAADSIYLVDRDCIYMFMNRTHLARLGLPLEEVIGKTYGELHPKKQSKEFRKRVNEVFETGRSLQQEHRSSRDRRYFLRTFSPMEDPLNGEIAGVTIVSKDITKRKQAEDELRRTLKELRNTKDMVLQSEKLAEIGQLAAGLTHEVLSPAAMLGMELQFMGSVENLSDELKQSISVCQEQITRIIRLTRNMGKFARLTKSERNPVQINQVIEHILAIILPRFRSEGVELDIQYGSGLPLIPINVNRIEQVFFNIINNALDSMLNQELKVLRVETGKAASTKGQECLRIVLTDTGGGVLPEHLTKVFDPFFTTKGLGTGTGLGLFVSRGIIQEHGGRIWAENSERGGASFFIELPV